ncbi:M16 family metallopeptidase [Dyella subtropica]|uniref:M16 family metallopeptidase n=1 Tax=Dyella subtropica TaxID=2992127 RepID=UPI00225B2436|nr:pitrilysin family protein [Dyella subtropica]
MTNMTFKTLALALGLSLAGITQASTAPLPKDLPAYAPDKPLPVPQITQRTLPNGLTVWVVPRTEGLPKVSLSLAVLGGTASDDASTPAISSLLAGLLNEGTDTLSSQQIAEHLQTIGGDYGAEASDDAITITADALSAHAPELVQLVADTVLHPSFPEKEVILTKANALQSLKARDANPNWQAQRAFSTAAFGDHPYARSSITTASIEATTPASMKALHAKRFRPDRTVLVIAGRISADEAMTLAEQQFGGWKGEGPKPAVVPAAPSQVAPQRLLVTREGAVQSNIRYGRPTVATNHPDYIPLAVTNVILGGSFSSRLVQDIREDKGYSYSPRSRVASFREGGNALAQVDVRNEVTGATLSELTKLYDSMGTQAPSDEELNGAKRLAIGGYLLSNQIQSTQAGSLARFWVEGLPASYLGTYVAKAQAVTADQVQAIGRKYFAAKDQSIIVVGDPKAIDGQLKPYGEFKPFKP